MKWHAEQSEQESQSGRGAWERRTFALFRGEDDGYMWDAELLESLAVEKLNPTEVVLRLAREMNERGVSVQFIKENISFTASNDDPRSTLMFTMLSALAQFERALIKERQREGIALAKAKGNVYKGRKRALSPEKATVLRHRVRKGSQKVGSGKRVRNKSRDPLSLYKTIKGERNRRRKD